MSEVKYGLMPVPPPDGFEIIGLNETHEGDCVATLDGIEWNIFTFGGTKSPAEYYQHWSKGVKDDGGDSQTLHIAFARKKPLPDAIAALKRAVQLATIAADWDLGTDGRVEIDGEWVSCFDLAEEFQAAITKATTQPA